MLGLLTHRASARLEQVSRQSEVVPEDGSGLLVCDLLGEDDLVFATDADIKSTMRRLEYYSERDDKKTFALRQQAYGFTYTPGCLLLDATLENHVKPATQAAFDWMHCFMVSGVFSTILFLVLEDVSNAGSRFVSNCFLALNKKRNQCAAPKTETQASTSMDLCSTMLRHGVFLVNSVVLTFATCSHQNAGLQTKKPSRLSVQLLKA